MTTKCLNLYAGIGGNRKLWEDVDVTAVEYDPEIAEVYRDNFPGDDVVIADAHEFLLEHFDEYDFIWASSPCPTHSTARKMMAGEGRQNDPVYPDMRLYQEVLFLQGYYAGDWVVENVVSWYDPLITPYESGRHYFWSNFFISDLDLPSANIRNGKLADWADMYGFDLSSYGIPSEKLRKMLRNCVHPKLGKHVLDAALGQRQTTLEDISQ